MKFSSNPVRGTRDILPSEMRLRDEVEGKILKMYRSHGFHRIETPAIESLNLLLGSEGGENLKMIYKILKRGAKLNLQADNLKENDICDMGLRYDLTLPLSRFYSNHANDLELPFKAIQVDNVFRAERPQKGRFRSFKQCDIDILGDPTENAEIELISTTAKALSAIGFEGFTIRINDRRILSTMITAAGFPEEAIGSVCITLDKLDKIGLDGVKAELAKNGYEEKVIDAFVASVDTLNFDTLADFAADDDVKKALIRVVNTVDAYAKGAYKIEFDPTLVRGMGYYTGLIFEANYGPYGYSIAGGGRYDEMIGRFSKTSVPAVGFSIGFERIIGILMEEALQSEQTEKRIALVYRDDADWADILPKADELRQEATVSCIRAKKKLGKQLNQLKNLGYTHFMVFGRDDEIAEL
jgi:histidyl-tRNA synthetase